MGVNRVAVVGAGKMGSGIAQTVATQRMPVALVDVTRGAAEAAKNRIEKLLVEGLERGVVGGPEVDAILGRIHASGDLADAGEADLVIEAIDEDLEAKRELLGKLGDACRADAILATNTSSFVVADLATKVSRPQRVVGTHYFFHPVKNHLVEVIGHDGTDPEVIQAAWTFQERIGKTPIRSNDSPGFVVNRFLVPWLHEAVRLHADGHALMTVDAEAKKSFGVPMGPFELMNATGVPMVARVARALGSQLGPPYEPPTELEKQLEPWSLIGEPAAGGQDEIRDRLWGAVLHAVLQLLSEGVSTPADIDIGARVGLRWSLGPIEQMASLGPEGVAQLASAFCARASLGPPPALAALRDGGALPEVERVRLTVANGVATVLINRPDRLNLLDAATLEQLAARFDEAHQRADVYGIVIAGAGKAFVAGADAAYLVERMRAGAHNEVIELFRRGQDLFRRIEASDKRVVCRLDGIAGGAGAQLALACHAIVATPRASFEFPETGLGIIPALGGTQRLTRRVGRGIARYLLYTGVSLPAEQLEALSLVWRVVEADDLADALRLALDEAPVQPPADPAGAPRGLSDAGRFLGAVQVDGLLDGSVTLPGGVEIMEVARTIRSKALHAVRSVESLTVLGESADLAGGLAAEIESLKMVLRTADALEGLSAALENRAPVFKGH